MLRNAAILIIILAIMSSIIAIIVYETKKSKPTSSMNTPRPTSSMNTPIPTSSMNTPRPGQIQSNVFYNAQSGQKLSSDNSCYNCHLKNNQCACYVNNNCSISSQGFQVPSVCNSIPCLQYETQDEDGYRPNVCNDNGLNLFKRVVNDPYLCNSSDPLQTCINQCEQGDYPFDKFPMCRSCCQPACQQYQHCSSQSGNKKVLPTPASGNNISCDECDTLYHESGDQGMKQILGFGYDECKKICV